MNNHKISQKPPFVQKDVFKELSLAETAVKDIYQFKEDFKVKTVYENYNGLYKFGQTFKFFLSFLTGFLASIGLFFLFYFDQFTGVFSYFFIGLASLFGLGVAYGIEYAKHILLPIISQSWLRDNKVQKGLVFAVLCLAASSITSTGYGTYKVIDLFYVPSLINMDDVGAEQENLILEYQDKITKAEAEKAEIDTKRKAYTKRTGRSTNGWIDKDVYDQLTADISVFEAQIIQLRENIRTDKKDAKGDNTKTETEHAQSKYAFVWVGLFIAFLSESLLLLVLFFLQKYKFATLKQLDTIQSPIQTVLQLVQNPLSSLKTHLIEGNGLAIISGQNVGTNINTNPSHLNIQKQPENEILTANLSEEEKTPIGFRNRQNSKQNANQKTTHNPLKPQGVSTKELAKIELKILHYEKMVQESKNKEGKLKQKAAIERNKKALKNRREKLRYWEKKKEGFQGKVLE